MFGTPDETLALVFDVLHQHRNTANPHVPLFFPVIGEVALIRDQLLITYFISQEICFEPSNIARASIKHFIDLRVVRSCTIQCH